MAHHKVADARWTPLPTPPHLDRETRYLSPPSTAATLNLAAVAAAMRPNLARYRRAVRRTLPRRGAAGLCRREAQSRAFLSRPIHRQRRLFRLGRFRRIFWAAAELYTTTGEAAFAADLRASPHFSDSLLEPAWPRTAPLGAITLALVPNHLRRARSRRSARASPPPPTASWPRKPARAIEFPYAAGCRAPGALPAGITPPPLPPSGHCYPWGSNSTLLNRAMLIALAGDFTGDARYRAGVVDVMDYLLGRNPLDQSFMSAAGARGRCKIRIIASGRTASMPRCPGRRPESCPAAPIRPR